MTKQLLAVWVRYKRCWALFRDPAAFARMDAWARRIGTIEGLLLSPEAEAIAAAVEKVAADRSFHPSKDHEVKRREALEWAGHWARERGLRLRSWELHFLLEWTIGVRKRRL